MTCGPIRRRTWRRRSPASARRRAQGAKIVCLQELFRSQYFCQTRGHRARSIWPSRFPGRPPRRSARSARQHGVVVVGSLFERRAAGLYHNTAVVFDADGSHASGMYRKMHIPDDPLYYEKFYFTPGDLGFRSFDTASARIGVLVCWDQWYPEAARLTALQRRGDPLLSHGDRLAAAREGRSSARRSTTPGRRCSAATRSPTACSSRAVNRVGHEGRRCEFWGSSFVADPFGSVLARGSRRPGGDPARRVRSRLIERDAAQLAVPARPPDRRLRRPARSASRRRERRMTPPAARSATACRPSGSRTRRPGSPGRTRNRTWPGKFAPMPRRSSCEMVRALAPARARSTSWSTTTAPARAGAARCSAPACALANVRLHVIADRRRLDARPRPDLRARPRAGELRARSTGASTPGAGSTRRWDRDDVGAARVAALLRRRRRSARASCSRAARSTSTATARCSTTEQCLLNPNRNPELVAGATRAAPARLPRRAATCSGSATASWATTPTATSTTWRASSRRATVVTRRRGRPGRRRTTRRSQDNLRAAARHARRRRPAAARSSTLPMPRPRRCTTGERLPASYANFYIANGVVLVPVFEPPTTPRRSTILRGAVPDAPRRGDPVRDTWSGAWARSTA